MIRPFTLITMLLAAGSGAYLFGVKHHAQMLDDQIAGISQASRLDAQRIRVLQAQWALEIDPTRLQQLASQFTDLQPMQPAQLITLAALRTSLPPAGSVAPASNPELPNEAPPEIASVAQDGASGGLPMPPPEAPVLMASAMASVVASATPAPRLPAIHVARHVKHPVLANAQMADAAPPRPYQAPHVFAPAIPVQRSMPMGAQVMSVKASATVPQYVPAPVVSQNESGSALGMAADLPPPPPLPQSGLNN